MFAPRILALLAAGAAIAPVAVSAAPVSDGVSLTRQIHVQTDDLNLANAAGQRTLQARIEHATNQVCGAADLSNPAEFQEMARCQQIALSEAKPQIANALARSTPRLAQAPSAPAPTNTASGS